MPKYFISGASGFISSHLIDKLLKDKNNFVVGYDNFFRGKIENISHHLNNKNFLFIEGDIRNYNYLYRFMAESDIVFHLAAQSNVMGSVDNPDYCFEANVIGTYNVLKACKENNIKKIVFTSSREVYGDTSEFPISEEHILNSKNIYGSSKVSGEALCRSFKNTYGINISILRFANVYGKRDFGRVIPDWIDKIKNDEIIPIYGGNQILDFIYIDYIIDSLLSASIKNFDYPINIGSGQGTSILQLLEYFNTIFDKKVKSIIYPPRNIETTGYVADVSKMINILNVLPPKNSLEDMKNLL